MHVSPLYVFLFGAVLAGWSAMGLIFYQARRHSSGRDIEFDRPAPVKRLR
jgi:hypothetical protein